MCCKRIKAQKYHHIFLWAITTNDIKHFLRVKYKPTCWDIKKYPWTNGFKSPALAFVSSKFFPECKQSRDSSGHPEYVLCSNIYFQTTEILNNNIF